MNPIKTLIALACATTALAVHAETPSANPAPYAGKQARAIKALSETEVEDLMAGRGMGLSKAAELNRRPGPRHVLDLSEPLALSDTQRVEIKAVFDRMDREARSLGALIVDKERALDARFARADIGRDEVERSIAEIAQLQGRLRFVHIDAHLTTARALSTSQVAAYDRLRGYGDTSAATTHDHSH